MQWAARWMRNRCSASDRFDVMEAIIGSKVEFYLFHLLESDDVYHAEDRNELYERKDAVYDAILFAIVEAKSVYMLPLIDLGRKALPFKRLLLEHEAFEATRQKTTA